eukprot:562941-Amphidinium_carterae.2
MAETAQACFSQTQKCNFNFVQVLSIRYTCAKPPQCLGHAFPLQVQPVIEAGAGLKSIWMNLQSPSKSPSRRHNKHETQVCKNKARIAECANQRNPALSSGYVVLAVWLSGFYSLR